MADDACLRIDLFLWWTRLARTREVAQSLACGGRLRIDGRVIEKAHCPVRVGNVLTFAVHDRVRVLRVELLPRRRGPAPEAQACYLDLLEPANVSQQACHD